MMPYAVIFFVIALVAAVFGFANLTQPGGEGIAKILFFVFLILAVVSFIANTAREPRTPKPKKKSQHEIRLEREARLQSLFPMGREFLYLSLHMRVVGHRQYSWDNSEWWPLLRLEYAAGAKIHTHEMDLEECEVLAKQLSPRASP